MRAKDLSIWLCRFLSIYCLLCAIGASQSYFQSLALIFNMEFVFGTIGTAKTGKPSPGVSWSKTIIAGIPVALYLLAAAILWWRASEISEKTTEHFSEDFLEFNLSSKISSAFIISLVGLYVVVSCIPQLIYLIFSFFESYQSTIRGRVLSSTGQIICSFLQVAAGAILIWRSKEIARRLSIAEAPVSTMSNH